MTGPARTISRVPVHVVKGEDELLASNTANTLVDELVGDRDRSLVVELFDGDGYTAHQVVDAARTPPFLVDRRVVVARGVERFTADDLDVLCDYLNNPGQDTELVLVWYTNRVPKRVVDLLNQLGVTPIGTDPGNTQKTREKWVAEQIGAAGLNMTQDTIRYLTEQLGEDVSRLPALLGTLTVAYGTGPVIGPEDVAVYLTDPGGIPPWDLTDAIDQGNPGLAVERVGRMIGAGRHPLQVMAMLHAHYVKLLTLDGAGVTSDQAAAELLGLKSVFPAKKALQTYRKVGRDGLVKAFGLLTEADLDLRGQRAMDGLFVLQILVARLARLTT